MDQVPSPAPAPAPPFSAIKKLRDFWKHWDIQLMVLLSLVLQLILILLGNRRKFSRKLSLRFLVWCAYISADSIASLALGILSSKLGDLSKHSAPLDRNIQLNAFWAPALLLLLAGPDTITAYSLEDNELWLRHMLSLMVQATVTVYVYAMVWSVSDKSFLALLMMLAGLIKCGERVWVLYLASSEKFRESMLNPPDSYPSYVRFMEEYSLKQAEGYYVTIDGIVQAPTDLSTRKNKSITDVEELVKADRMLQIFKRLFVDLLVSNNDRELSLSIFKNIRWKSAFKMVEIELAFMYDLIFTKAMILYTRCGFCRRAITLTITCIVLATFSFQISTKKRSDLKTANIVITFVLFAVLILMEIYSLLLLLSSDWIDVWLSKCDENSPFLLVLTYLRPRKQRRWSNSMGQFNLLSFCIDEEPLPCHRLLKRLRVDEKLNMYQYTHHKPVPKDLKEILFQKIQAKIEKHDSDFDHKRLVIGVWKGYSFSDQFSSDDLEFDKCILIWHVATEICSHSIRLDSGRNKNMDRSLLLSRYMFHLLVSYPFMLPVGIGKVRLRDTFADGKKYFEDKRNTSSQNNVSLGRACEMLCGVNTEIPPEKVIGARNKSALFDGCRIASELVKVKDPNKLQLQWDMMCEMWVGLLFCAAAATKQCRGSHHAQQLRRGGELISHVWLLLAHFGLTDHFEKTEGHILAKMQ